MKAIPPCPAAMPTLVARLTPADSSPSLRRAEDPFVPIDRLGDHREGGGDGDRSGEAGGEIDAKERPAAALSVNGRSANSAAASSSTTTQPLRIPVRARIGGATKAESSSVPATAGSITPIIQGARSTSIAKIRRHRHHPAEADEVEQAEHESDQPGAVAQHLADHRAAPRIFGRRVVDHPFAAIGVKARAIEAARSARTARPTAG